MYNNFLWNLYVFSDAQFVDLIIKEI